MKKALVIALGVIFLLASLILPLASALTDSDAVYLIKQYSSLDLKRPCFYNGSNCGATTICNATINYLQGNATILYNNTEMTNQGTYFNITLKSHDTAQAGWYQMTTTCEDRGDYGSEVIYFRITPTGDEDNTNTFIMIGVIFSLIIAFGFLIRDEYVVFIGGATALIAGIYSMAYGFGSTQTDFTRMISIVVICLGIIFTIQPAYSLIESSGETGYEEILDSGDI